MYKQCQLIIELAFSTHNHCFLPSPVRATGHKTPGESSDILQSVIMIQLTSRRILRDQDEAPEGIFYIIYQVYIPCVRVSVIRAILVCLSITLVILEQAQVAPEIIIQFQGGNRAVLLYPLLFSLLSHTSLLSLYLDWKLGPRCKGNSTLQLWCRAWSV